MTIQGLSSYLPRASPLPFRMSTTTFSMKCSCCQAPIVGMAMSNESVQHQGNADGALGSCSSDLWSSLSPFLDDKQRVRLDTSQTLLGLSASLFDDVNGFSMDKEDPPEYIPAPTQSAADMELSKQLDNVLYMLRELLPGPIRKIGMDNKLLEEASRLVHANVKIQDPLLCLQGKDKLGAWLYILAMADARVNLHEIYGERSIATPCEKNVYAIWTLLIPGELQSTSQLSNFEGAERNLLELSLSGETKFEVDGVGQVVSIESNWYVPRGREEMLETVKERLLSLLHNRMSND